MVQVEDSSGDASEADDAAPEEVETSPGTDGPGPDTETPQPPTDPHHSGAHRTAWIRAWLRPSLLAGLGITAFFVAMALLSPLWYPRDLTSLPVDTAMVAACGVPSGPTLSFLPLGMGPHPFGETLSMGYDVLEGLVVGSRWDLMLITLITAPAAVMGTLVGLSAASYGGKVDWLLMTVTDAILSFPYFVFVILAVILLSPRVPADDAPYLFIGAMIAVLWAPFARGVRGEASRVLALPFVEASRAAGARRGNLLRRHVLPNSLTPVLVQIPITIALILALVIGVQYVVTYANAHPPYGEGCGWQTNTSGVAPVTPSAAYPEWGLVLAAGSVLWAPGFGPVTFLSGPWWGFVIPALWISLFGLGVILLFDGIRDAWEPRGTAR